MAIKDSLCFSSVNVWLNMMRGCQESMFTTLLFASWWADFDKPTICFSRVRMCTACSLKGFQVECFSKYQAFD